MGTFIKIPFPSLSGTLVGVDNVKTILKKSDTSINIHFNDGTLLDVTNTSDSTFKTLKSFNDAMTLAKSSKTAPNQATEVSLPTGISVSAVAVISVA